MGAGSIPLDDNGKPVLGIMNDATGQVLPLHIGSTVTGADGKTYATLDTNIRQDQYRALVVAGQVFMLSITATSTGASNAAIMLWGGAGGITKNTILLSATTYTAAGNSNTAYLRTLSATDAGVATQQTPVNLKSGGGASLYTGANAAVNAPTNAATSYSGTAIRFAPAIPQNNVEVLPPGGYYIPASTVNTGIELTMSQASAGLYAMTLVWAEI